MSGPTAGGPTTKGPTTVYVGGPIYPRADGRAAEALAVRGGRVLAVGTRDEVRSCALAAGGPAPATVDLDGDTLLPGLTDAHVHVWKVGQLRTTLLDLRGVSSRAEFERLVRERHAALPEGAWLWGRGWNEAVLGFIPDRALLDALAPGRAALLTRTCAHVHAVSGEALRRAGIDASTPPPPGGEIDAQSGRLAETAYGLVWNAMPAPDRAQYEAWILAGLEHLASLGVTAATDPAVDAPLYEAYRALDAAGKLPLRVNLLYIRRPDGGRETLPLPEQHLSARLRCDSVKFFLDGGLSGATAALNTPYRVPRPDGRPNLGVLRFDPDDLFELAREAHVAGFRIGAHAIGDAALDQLLGVYARLAREHPGGPRHRVEHFGLPSAEHLRLARELRVIAVPQPIFLHELRENYARAVPPELADRVFPLAPLFDAGLDVAFSSDGPVVRDLRPLAGVKAAVLEPFVPGTAVTVAQALGAYTRGGAVAHGDEAERGTLDPGQLADLTRLGADPFGTPPDLLPDLPVRGALVAESETP